MNSEDFAVAAIGVLVVVTAFAVGILIAWWLG